MILISGSTGFVGRQLIGRLLSVYPDVEIGMLIRGDDYQKRGERILKETLGEEHTKYLKQVTFYNSDLRETRLGLSPLKYDELKSKLTTVFHSAANTDLGMDLIDARKANVVTTGRLLELSKRSKNLSRFNFISTAYVAGKREDIVTPFETGHKFKNGYEQSKAEAEGLVLKSHLPYTIFRPSIIVGDSLTGATSAFNVIYAPTRFFVRGVLNFVPGLPSAICDLVPVDYVADSIVYLSSIERTINSSYHLTAGLGEETTLSEVIEQILFAFSDYYDNKVISFPQYLSPDKVHMLMGAMHSRVASLKKLESVVGARLSIIRQTLPFVPYMMNNPRFDASATKELLVGTNIVVPNFKTYAERLFRFCFETDWGKNITPDRLLISRANINGLRLAGSFSK